MRTIIALSLLLIATASAVQAADREGVVKTDEIALLSGPGSSMPESARLRRGAKLRVHHEEGDYYAVQPPAGCISWIRMSYLQFVSSGDPSVFPCAAVVNGNGLAKLRAGKVGVAKPLDVERISVADGTVLTIVGQKTDDNGVKWYPIASPEDDYRYVLKSTIDLGNSIESKFTVTSPNSGPTGMIATSGNNALTASIPPPASGANWNNPQWIEAQRAERAGDLDRAEKIYLDLAKEMNRPGGVEKLAEDCYARIHDIRERRRRAGLGSGQSSLTPSATDRNSKVIPDATTVGSVTSGSSGTSGSRTGGNGSGRQSANLNSTNRSTESNPASEIARWEGPGTLYLSALRVNGEKIFALQANPRSVLTYAIPGKGVDLSKLTNQVVRLYGTVVPLTGYPGMSLMTVTNVDVVK